MFSGDSKIRMASNNDRNISSIVVGDLIMNKFNKIVKVIAVHSYAAHDSVAVQLNNGSNVFYFSPDTVFMCHHVLNNGSHESHNCIMSEINDNDAKLKSSGKIFSNESDIEIVTYDPTNVPNTLYCIHTNDNTNTFFINNIIVSGNVH